MDIKNQIKINELPDYKAIKDIKIELTFIKNLPSPLFAKEGHYTPLHPSQEGIIPPFGKGRVGGILQNNVVIILRLLIRSS